MLVLVVATVAVTVVEMAAATAVPKARVAMAATVVGAVANTPLARKAPVAPKARAKAVAAHPWVTRSRAATKAVSLVALPPTRVHPAAHPAASPIRCVPVSI